MPSQGKIINAVNYCLKQRANIDFQLNEGGVCAGLAGLYVKYALENKINRFFDILNRLSKLPKTYKLGDDPVIDDFIIQIEKVYDPSQYSGFQLMQGELEKILNIKNKAIKNEFNIGLITDQAGWEYILGEISKNNRTYFIGSQNHALAISYKNGKYSIYDPNYNKTVKNLDSAKDVIKELKQCFDYSTEFFGLSIRVFSNPYDTPEEYPDHSVLHQRIYKIDEDRTRLMTSESRDYQASRFCITAKDFKTLRYLFKEHAFHWDKVTTEPKVADYNEILLEQPSSPELKKEILKNINLNISIGNSIIVERLIERYKVLFKTPSDQNDLVDTLRNAFSFLHTVQNGAMKKEDDRGFLISLCEQYHLDKEGDILTNYSHLKLLSLYKGYPLTIELVSELKALSPEQLIKQIQIAAQLNQITVLNLLIHVINETSVDLSKQPSIFNEDLVQKIHASTLKILIDNGFVADISNPNLLAVCALRRDKTLFELYARSFSVQEKQEQVWRSIDENLYDLLDLEAKIGPVPLLNALVYLKRNEHIKRAWRDTINVEVIKSALVNAILASNKDISTFLQEKLTVQKSALDDDTVEFLIQKALEDSNIDILSILVDLKFNILQSTKDIEKILFLCDDFDDFSPLLGAFPKASDKIKKLIFEASLGYSIQTVIDICVTQAQPFLNNYLTTLIKAEESGDRTNYLARINAKANFSLANAPNLMLSEPEKKSFISYCLRNNLFNLLSVCPKVSSWTKKELNELSNDLIGTKNEEGLIQLIKIVPELIQEQPFFANLVHNNLLNVVNALLLDGLDINKKRAVELFIAALNKDEKELVNTLLSQEKISPETQLNPPLMQLLKSLVENGHGNCIDLFINSKHDFVINFKELFFLACQHKQLKIANELLAADFQLNKEEVSGAVTRLFGEQTSSEIYDKVYMSAYGRLYSLLQKSEVKNPRSPLMSAIKEPDKDPSFQKTDLYLSPLKRAIKEKNKNLFEKLFTETELPPDVDETVLSFLEDPLLPKGVISLFEKKYGLGRLLAFALKQNHWEALANLLENHPMSDLSADLQAQIQLNSKQICTAYINNLEKNYAKADVRARLFQLLLYNTNSMILTQIALPYHEAIQKVLVGVELDMIKNHLDLNNQIYRHSFSSNVSNADLIELNDMYKQCDQIIKDNTINLKNPIEHEELISLFARIKGIMAKYGTRFAYLKENQQETFINLAQNPRFKKVCEKEFQLYSLLKSLDLEAKPLSTQAVSKQTEFCKAIDALRLALNKAKLPLSFVTPEIQSYMNSQEALKISLASTASTVADLKSKSLSGINNYLSHRDSGLSYLSYYFDYERGKVRAQHYQKLLEAAETPLEIYVLQYAILTNPEGKNLKKQMSQALSTRDNDEIKGRIKKEITKSSLKAHLAKVDDIIASINTKANDKESKDTIALFSEELAALKHLCRASTSPLSSLSFFKPEHQHYKPSLWQWISSFFGGKNNSEENKLSCK